MIFSSTVELKDQVSPAAKEAANKILVLQKAITSTQNSLIKASTVGNIGQYKSLTANLAAYKSELASTSQVQTAATASTSGLQLELAELTGGLSVVAEAAAAVAVGFGVLVLAGSALAIKAVEEKNALVSMFGALGEGNITGQETVKMLDDLSSKIGISRAQLAPFTKDFMSMGITSEAALQKLTTAAISAQAIVGDPAGAQAFETLTKKIRAASEAGVGLKIPAKSLQSLYKAGVTVNDVAGEMGVSAKTLAAQLKAGTANADKFGDALQNALIKKGAGPLQTLVLSTANLRKVFEENISKMFEDVNVKPFLAEVKSLFGIFSQAKPSGQALKSGITGFFNETFDIARRVVPYVRHFLEDLIILGLKAYIALKPIEKQFVAMALAGSKNAIVLFVFQKLLTTLKAVAVVIGIGLAVMLALAAGAVAFAASLVAAVVAIATFAGAIIDMVGDANKAIGSWILGAPDAAKNYISGLVQGITAGASQVVDATKNLASSAENAFKQRLGIASPSKVMAQRGEQTAQGVAVGMAKQTPSVERAADGMGASTINASSATMNDNRSEKSSSTSSASSVVNIAAGAIVIQGGGGKSDTDLTEQALADIFERLGLTQGVAT